MNLHFGMLISAEDSLHNKMGEALKDNPAVLMEVVKAFGQILLLALKLKEDDKVVITNFNFHPELKPSENIEKPVEVQKPRIKTVKLEQKRENFKGVRKPSNK